MVLTDEMKRALYLIENTDESLYITGKAGTGKTTFLKYLVENTQKRLVVTASTGVAAINAGGVTLHSLFNIPLSVQIPSGQMQGGMRMDKFQLFKALEVLVIDEVSMVRPDTIDYIDRKLRLYRLTNEPFGGVQVVMFGDLYQLPPVVKNSEKDILLQYYRGVYFFYARAFKNTGFRVIELTQVFRQREKRFVEILNNIRTYKLQNRDINDLDKLRNRRASKNYDDEYIHLCARKQAVHEINEARLGVPTHCFEAEIEGSFPAGSAPCDHVLRLRIGAKVMMLVNDPERRFYNGSVGVVTGLDEDYVAVKLENGYEVVVSPYEWVAHEYKMKDGKIITVDKGKCKQFPVTLAWAITIHKSQGLTFDKVVLHTKGIFAPGQLYVALSRCTSMSGIITESFIDKRYIIPDHELTAFERAYNSAKGVFNQSTYRIMHIR